jgi:hypothetical protein
MAAGIDGFLSELLKIAEAYRQVRGVQDRLRKDIPLLRLNQSMSVDEKLKRVADALKESKSEVMGKPQVAVLTKSMPSMADLGFKSTRLAVPLPGGKMLMPSYRKEHLHGHRAGDYTLLHRDTIVPKGLDALRHAVREGLPAWRLRRSELDKQPVQFAKSAT